MQDTFHFSKPYWTDENEYNPSGGKTGFDQQETKLPTNWNTSFSKICLGMKFDEQLRFIVINKQADSLYSLIADGKHRRTSLGRETWKTLLGDHASFAIAQSSIVIRKGSILNVLMTSHPQGLALWQITKSPAIRVIPGLGLVQKEGYIISTPVETWLCTQRIMETKTSKPWVTYWFSEWSLDK